MEAPWGRPLAFSLVLASSLLSPLPSAPSQEFNGRHFRPHTCAAAARCSALPPLRLGSKVMKLFLSREKLTLRPVYCLRDRNSLAVWLDASFSRAELFFFPHIRASVDIAPSPSFIKTSAGLSLVNRGISRLRFFRRNPWDSTASIIILNYRGAVEV